MMDLIPHRVRPAPPAGMGLLGRTFLLSAAAHVAVLGTLALTHGGGGGPPPRPATLLATVEENLPPEEPLPPMETTPPVEGPPPATTEILLEEFPVEPDPRLLPPRRDGTDDFPVIGIPGIGEGSRARSRKPGSGDGNGSGEGGPAPVPDDVPGVRPAPRPAVVVSVARLVPGKCPAPPYPERERQRGVEGSLRLRVTVAADGSVAEVEVAESSGSEALDRSAVETVRGWTFIPCTEDGVPMASVVLQPFSFHLR